MVRQVGLGIINFVVPTGLGLTCLWAAYFSHLVGVQCLQTAQRYYCVCPLTGNQDLAPGLHYVSQFSVSRVWHPLPSLISNCLYLLLGSWMKPISCNEKVEDPGRLLCPGAPQGPARCQFQVLFWILNKFSIQASRSSLSINIRLCTVFSPVCTLKANDITPKWEHIYCSCSERLINNISLHLVWCICVYCALL